MSKPSNQRVAYHHLTDREEMEKTANLDAIDLKHAVKVLTKDRHLDAYPRGGGYEVTNMDRLRDDALDAAGTTMFLHSGNGVVNLSLGRHSKNPGNKKVFASAVKMLEGAGFVAQSTKRDQVEFYRKTASDEPTSVETVGALHFIKQIQRVADRTAGYKGREKMEIVTDLDIKVISGGWGDDEFAGPGQPLYGGDVRYKAKVYAVATGLLGNPTLWEDSGIGRIFSDPGGGFYFKPQGRVDTGNKGTDQIVRNSLDEAVYHNSGKITRAGSLHLAGWKVAGLEYAIQSGPVLDGGVLKIPSQKGLIEIKPGNRKAWFRFTVSLNGKDISKFPSGWSTEDDSTMHSQGRWDVGRKPEALGIQQTLVRYSMLKKNQIAKIEAWVYSHDDFRGLKLASTKEAAKKRKAVYVGVMLSDGDKKTLAAWWKKETGSDLLRKSYMHHMTIKFKPSPDEVLALPIGDTVPLKVVGWAADGQAQAVLVQPSGVRSTNSHPHVTVATDGTSPAYSNDLIKSGPVTKASGPTLKGRVGIFTGKDVQYDLTDTIYEEE